MSETATLEAPESGTTTTSVGEHDAAPAVKQDDGDAARVAWVKKRIEEKQAVLDAVGTDSKPVETMAGAQRGKDGKFVKQASDRKEPEKKEKVEPEGDEDIKPLERDGVPRDVLDAMKKKNPDALKEWAKKARERQSASDKLGNELDRLRRSARSEDGKASKADDAAGSSVEPAVDLDQAVQPFAKALTELVGEDAGVAEHLKTFGKTLLNQANSEVAQLRKVTENLLEKYVTSQFETARVKFKADYPGLEDDAAYQRVVERAFRLDKTDDYDSIDEAFKASAILEFHDQIVEQARSAVKQRDKKKDNGQMDLGDRIEPSEPDTLDTLQVKWIKARQTGDTEAERRIERRMKSLQGRSGGFL